MICPFRWYEIERAVQTPTFFENEPTEDDVALQSVCFDSVTTTTKEFYDCECENCACWIKNGCSRRLIK